MAAGKAPYDEFDPCNVGALSKIYEVTGCAIVLSSSWRIGSTLTRIDRLLRSAGWPYAHVPLIGQTPVMDSMRRADDIWAWLKFSDFTGPYVCLDDDNDFDVDQPLIQTSREVGLTLDDAVRAIDVLQTQPTRSERKHG
jgi:hypothetical protein